MEAADEFHDKTVFLKACFAGASGAGTDIRYCVDSQSRLAAITWFTARGSQLTALRMEVDVPVTSCWCVNLAINESGVRYLGAATQVFSRPGLQIGSLIDPTDQPTSEIIDITLAIGDVARQRGYVGIAGFDIGIDASGHAWVFDLNFRITACTVQILLHDSTCRRINGRISKSLGLNIPGPLAPALERLTPFVDRGCFVPQRLYERTPGVDQFSVITAILIATDQDEVNSIEAVINDAIHDLLSDSP